ncbi:uncharacterized protein LOC117651716 [Thrips palmi]|uniref:Uncharacterized protein LOC117651716 n=1 Tax=Thrips palmi TaxID=161013 RepID=A0A6P9A259_THRPL|nr:uncharacterized protein LOC117651716 [Thrips palmi]
MRGLLILDVTNDSGRPLPSDWCETVGVPSLTRLRYDSPSADPFLELLLRTHAATLRHVELHRLDDVPAVLLARALQLRSLKCLPCEGLSKLVDLPGLAHIDLYCEGGSDDQEGAAFPPGTLAFLSGASHLRSVKLCLSAEDPDAPLRALSTSPSAQHLQELVALADNEDPPETFVTTLVTPFLPSFTSLRTLIVDDDLEQDFLLAVSPTVLPCLTTLKVDVLEDSCMHGTLHRPAVHDVLMRNPHLHLYIEKGFPEKVMCNDCPWCKWGCHELLAETKNSEVCYSSHSKSATCPKECFQAFSPSNPLHPSNN